MEPLKLFTSNVEAISAEQKAKFCKDVRNPKTHMKHIAEIAEESCEACGSTENLIESGGQFCGGDWWLCKKCDDESTRIAEFYNSRFKEQLERKKNGSKDAPLS